MARVKSPTAEQLQVRVDELRERNALLEARLATADRATSEHEQEREAWKAQLRQAERGRNPRVHGQLLQLLREFDQLAMHMEGPVRPERHEYGPSIFETKHDVWLHDEGKPCPHCRAGQIVTEIRQLVEAGE